MEENQDSTPRTFRHGGARRGAGRKPKDYVKTVVETDYDEARAKLEHSRAQLAELELLQQRQRFVDRESVVEACETAYSMIEAAITPLPAVLGQRLALHEEATQMVATTIRQALADLARTMSEISAPGPFSDVLPH